MAVTLDDGTVKAEDLAEFIWCAEYDCSAYPWANLTDEERAYYRDCANALVRKFHIEPR